MLLKPNYFLTLLINFLHMKKTNTLIKFFCLALGTLFWSGTALAQPANDLCAGAIPITPSPAGTGCGTFTFTAPASTDGTTDSGVPTVCSNPGLDLWFTWTATTDGLIFNDGLGSPGIAIFANCADAAAGNEIACTNTFAPVDSRLSGWAIGDNLIIQIYDFNGSTSDLSWCLEEFTVPPPPPNDDCATAIDYTATFGAVGVGDCPANSQTIDITEYTDSGEDPTCDFGGDATAWYTWTANTTSVDFTSGTSLPGLEILEGSCGAFTSLGCLNNTSGTIGGLTVGNQYYIIIWDDGLAGTTLGFCLTATPPPPVNDACTTPTVLPVIESDMCGAQTLGTNVSATPSGELPAPSCGTFGSGEDIWYEVTIPLSGAVNVEVSDAGGPGDWVMSIYSGACGALVEEACNDDTNGLFPAITLTGRTPGEVLLVRLFEFGNNATGPVNICAFSPALVCDLVVTSEASTDETCLDAEDGTITITTSTSFGPVTYNLTGPVNLTNSTGMFTGLPQGTYTYTATDDGFPAAAGDCSVMGGPITIAGDGIAPVVTCPTASTLDCNAVPEAATSVDEFVAQGGSISDACPIVSLSSVDIAVGDICPTTGQQIITRTYSATDNSGNVGTCAQTFTIINSTSGPVITSIPLDQTVDCEVNAFPQMNLFSAEGDCSGAVTLSVTEMPIIGNPGCNNSRIQFMYTAMDGCGRTANHIQTYTLANEGPQFVSFNEICRIESPADLAARQAQFDEFAELASVNTSCVESTVTITNNFNPNFFINQNCANPFISVDNATAYQIVTFRATDNCGRFGTETALVVIVDTEGPVVTGSVASATAECNSGNLQGDYTTWANFQISTLLAEDAGSPGTESISYSPLTANTNCAGGSATTEVTFTATDACGNATTLSANYVIFDSGVVATATVSGTLMTEEDEAIELAEVEVDGYMNNMLMTNSEGFYQFDLMTAQNYAISPSRNDNPLNGITTYDLILLGQHLLELNTLDSPYKLIAADVNESGSITALDLIELRRMILLLDDQFSAGKSWTFVDANYVFPDPTNPFATTYPTVYNINNLTTGQVADFIGVKLGDLNGSASAAFLQSGDTRSNDGILNVKLEDEMLQAGQTYDLAFTASDFKDVAGFQFTLDFAADYLQVLDYQGSELSKMSADNFGFAKANQGKVTVSWNETTAINMADDATLFTMSFTALKDAQLSEVMAINSSLTASEAYQADLRKDVTLDFGKTIANGNEFALLQNRPNPFNNETLIAFNLPEMTTATLTIYDVAGRVLKQQKGDFNKGYNEITISRAELSGSGLLYYQLETPTDVATMKMIVQ